MRGMIHLNLGEVNAAREITEEIDLAKAPDAKSPNLTAVVAEAWHAPEILSRRPSSE